MLEQYKVDALRGALTALIKDNVSASDDDLGDELVIHLSDSAIRRFVENLEGIIGKEAKHHES